MTEKRRIRRPSGIPSDPRPQGQKVREVAVGIGLPDVENLALELQGYVDVLMGRVPPPRDFGDLTLMEIADAYYARACEIQMQIQKAEREGGVFKGTKYYRFRTGELRTFLELTKRAADLGSRRLTQARLEFDMEMQEQGLEWSS